MKCPECDAEVSQINGEFFCLECGKKINVSNNKNPEAELDKEQTEQTSEASSTEDNQPGSEGKKIKRFSRKSPVDSIYPKIPPESEEKKEEGKKNAGSVSQNNLNIDKKINEPRGLGQLLNDGLNVFIKNFKTFALLVIAIQLPLLSILYVFSFTVGISLYNQLSGVSISPENSQEQFKLLFEKISSPLIISIFSVIMLIFIFLSIF